VLAKNSDQDGHDELHQRGCAKDQELWVPEDGEAEFARSVLVEGGGFGYEGEDDIVRSIRDRKSVDQVSMMDNALKYNSDYSVRYSSKAKANFYEAANSGALTQLMDKQSENMC
jgi:hypothetical protein